MLASMVIVMVGMGNLNGTPGDRLDLSDQHFIALTSSCPVKIGWNNPCLVCLALLQVPLDGSHVYVGIFH